MAAKVARWISVVALVALVAVVAAASTHGPQGHVSELQRKPWIAKRPSMFGGVQTTEQHPLFLGVMWHEYWDSAGGAIAMREHTVNSNLLGLHTSVTDGDGVSFGNVRVEDTLIDHAVINSAWVSEQDQSQGYRFRVSGDVKAVAHPGPPDHTAAYAVYLYLSTNATTGALTVSPEDATHVAGLHPSVGHVSMTTTAVSGNVTSVRFLELSTERPYRLAGDVVGVLSRDRDCMLPCSQLKRNAGNAVVLQLIVRGVFSWDVHVAFGDRAKLHPRVDAPGHPTKCDPAAWLDAGIASPALTWSSLASVSGSSAADAPPPARASAATAFDTMFAAARQRFDAKFSKVFPHWASSPSLRATGRSMLTHLLHGLAYYYGDRVAYDPATGMTLHQAPIEHYALTPSMIGFPRPFWWDDGFHQMILLHWDPDMSAEIIRSWFRIAESNGWVAREQVIGPEARDATPEWAWYGQMDQMNPPVLYLTLQRFVHAHPSQGKQLVRSLWPDLMRTYSWYLDNSKTVGHKHRMVWPTRRRRGHTAVRAQSIESGLDDYPRPEHYVPGEASVDLQSWIIRMTDAMIQFATLAGDRPDVQQLQRTRDALFQEMSTSMWDAEAQYFGDLHGDGFIVHPYGFPGMMPLCLGLLDEQDPRVGEMLEQTQRHLLTKFGLASLALRDRNATINGNYWRGNIWGNQQHLCAQGLAKYQHAWPLAATIRSAVVQGYIKVVVQGNLRNDYIFETYHPTDGHGYNHRPFTGWTTLALVMLEDLASDHPGHAADVAALELA